MRAGFMRTRQKIKEYAKGAFEAQRNTCVLGLFIVMLLTLGFPLASYIFRYLLELFALDYNAAFLGGIFAINVVFSTLAFPVAILSQVLGVNASGFFVKVYYGQSVKYSEPYSEIKNNFGRKLGGKCWQMLWVCLWTLAFITPGVIIMFLIGSGAYLSSFIYKATTEVLFNIYVLLYVFGLIFIPMLLASVPVIVKVLSYSMTQYILASNPNVKATDAIKLSMRMTKGHKGKIFIMWMSFLGWQILSFFTIGILGIFYVNPYMYTSFAGLFVELRSLAVERGVVHPSELDGIPLQQVPVPYYQHYQYTPEQPYTGYQQQPQYTLYTQQQTYPQPPYYVPEPVQSQIPQAPPIPEPPSQQSQEQKGDDERM